MADDGPSRGIHRWQIPITKQSGLWLLLALALTRGLVYALLTPPWQAPDETGHFEYAWLTAHLGRLPTAQDLSADLERDMLASMYEWRYGEFIARPLPEIMPTRLEDLPANIFARGSRTVLAGRFSLAYLWQALFLLPVRAQDLVLQLLMARFSSILLSLGIVWLAFRTFQEIVPARSSIAFVMTLVVVLMPQHTFINSMVGDGTLAELMASLVLLCWVRVFRRGARALELVGIILGTLAGNLSKATAVYLIPLDVALAVWWLVRQRRRPWTWRQTAYVGISLGIVAGAALLWSQSALGAYTLGVLSELSSRRLTWVDPSGMTLFEALLINQDTFWARFGWLAVSVSSRWYGAILLLTGIAALGWVVGLPHARRSPATSEGREDGEFPSWAVGMMAAAFSMAFLVFAWVTILFPPAGGFGIQGRYLFPAVIPFSFLLVGGWLHLWPSRRQIILLAGVLFLAAFDAWSVMCYVIPYFYYR